MSQRKGDSAYQPLAKAGRRVEVHKTDLAKWPFCTLSEFAGGASGGHKRILLVAPLSGHFAFILREMVLGLVRERRCQRHRLAERPLCASVGRRVRLRREYRHHCRSIKISAPAPTSSRSARARCPRSRQRRFSRSTSLNLRRARSFCWAGRSTRWPIPRASSSFCVKRRRHGSSRMSWIRSALHYPGARRMVYPARHQMSALAAYFYRHWASGGELFKQMLADDGLDP